MTKQFLDIEAFNKLLQKWNGKQIKVSKQELNDYDEAIIDLSAITYETHTRRLDDYEPLHTLQLNGAGKVKTDYNSYQTPPTFVYEIPLEDSSLYQFDGERFALVTDRAIYTIEIFQ
ncbi:hypothetical protein CAI16_13700 [Virgibacillus dokdonensis]|uniref:Uncharacterized protein n=1 Tax=Virgibacillus dokdonensis TaxID=302167 RepID=A0A3E0WLR2_9BACI|nr:hypothetical protein [Virgibacillus dokdonensis]RFA33748.1 hypothetical protein CAI16_13700 [Virgibacillus dokdonensis]